MSKVFFDVAMSLDGFIAPDGMDMEHANDPSYKNWMKKWGDLQHWVFPLKFFRENLKIGEGGATGAENDMIENVFNRTGVSIMGKNMFTGGEQFWPEEAPFHTPVYVLTHQVRQPWERPGGTTFYFVNDGIDSALRQARQAAGDLDIRIAGGANLIQQYLNAGLIDEFTIHYAPVVFGGGELLFKDIVDTVQFRVRDGMVGKYATHITYEVDR
jgi:dihydrofolate reductase